MLFVVDKIYVIEASYLLLFSKPPHTYINDAIIDKQSSINYITVPYVDMIGICCSAAIFCLVRL